MKLRIILLIILISCEDKTENNYIEISWINVANKTIYNCNEVSWCDESKYPNSQARTANKFYTIEKSGNLEEKFLSGVDVVYYWEKQVVSISYSDIENLLFVNFKDGDYSANVYKYDVNNRIISYKSN